MLFSLNCFFFFFFFFFFFSIYFYEFNIVVLYEWVLFDMNGFNLTLLLLFDWISLIFMSLVFLISGCVLFYSIGYMMGDKMFIRFFYFVFMFILSMIFFILIPDLISILIGWDGLGLISYCLVIYYQNSLSMISGLLTVLINRFGDVFLILSIGFFFNFGCWHFFLYNFFFDIDLNIFIYLILFTSFTSSAQFPFSFWLPCAMAAPTPVSSLVHSSTLVTSGIYLLIRFNIYLMNFNTYFLMYISLLTMFMSSLNALLENDLKKIIAFSTLSQLGFMFFVLSMGCLTLCFIHLLIHAIFKSLLFLCSGYFIHCFFGNQDIRFMGGLLFQCPYVSSCFFISLLCLCGFPFFSGFYSKDFILEFFYLFESSNLIFFFFLLSVFLTFMYSIRLIYYLFYCESFFFPLISFKYSLYMNLSMIFLYMFSLGFGSLLYWLFIDFIFFVDFSFKMLPLFIMFFSLFLCFNFLKNTFLLNSGYLVFFFSSMFYMNYFSSSFFLKRFFSFSMVCMNLIDNGWLEYFLTGGLISLLNWFSKNFSLFFLNSFYIYMVSFFIYIFFFLLFF
uniref:NADH dehydrogenase subunit 5 n=1 Tax=Neosymplana vittatum TaxID=2886259 RepID=UPI001E7F9843|nr:NADH dehydrogenase subunit 5 [Neosymplana vittatum]UDL71974.1 NADH dehydrogenase subunit 5 [Neosymplana vittatum]